MASDLTDDTVDVTRPAPRARRARSRAAGWNPRWCDSCNLGAHQCTGVACYGCDSPAHDRKPGVSGLGLGAEHGAPKPGGRR